MNDILRSELRKLRTTRSLLALPLVGVAVSAAAAAVLVAAFEETEIATRLSEHGPLRFGPTNVGLLMLLFGVRLFADETHHGTLGSTYVASPDRRAVLAAKAVVAVVVALGTCAAIYALVVPTTVLAVDRRDLPMALDLEATVSLFGRVSVAMTLMALLGLASAVLIRNRAVALVACVAWLAMLEGLVGGLLRIPKLLPGALVRGVVSGGGHDTLASGPAAAMLLAVVVAVAAAAVPAARRDVS